MRIAHVTDGYLPRMGGIERQVHGLAHAQLGLGHQIEVVTSVATGGADLESAGGAAIPVIAPARPRSRAGSIRYLATPSGRDAVLAGNYDLVHLHASTWSPLAYLTAAATTSAGIPTVVTVHSFWSWASPIFRGFDLALGWRQWPVTWTAVSQVAARALGEVITPDNPITVLPNGVTASLWRPDRLPRQRNRIVIVSVMRLAARKRPIALLRMLRELRRQIPAEIALDVTIIGDGPKRTAMQGFLRRHGMTDWVQLTGQLDQPEIRRVFDDADVYVCPSTLESFGIAALEARCAGLPVIAFADTGVSEFVRNGENGLLVGSDADMVSALKRVCTDPQLLSRLTERNLSTESGFDWPSVLSTCEQVYARAFERVGRPLPAPRPRTADPVRTG